MRSSVLLTSALAMGAIAGPIQKRYIVTDVELEIKTVTVYVTADLAEPTVQAVPTSSKHHSYGYGYPHSKPEAQPSSKAIPKPSSSSAVVVPSSAPAYSAPAYSAAPPPPSSTPAPKPTPAPTPKPAPSSVVVTSQAPVASSAPSYSAPSYNNDNHPTGEIQATLSSGAEYQAAVLYHHNVARANHGADPLVWDASCEANAKIAAQRCVFEHYIPEGAGQGQNLFTVSGDSFNVTAGITESWYKGEFAPMEPYWGSSDIPEEVFHSVGHLTQMVWKETTKVGCFSYDCGSAMKVGGAQSDLNKYTVCNYASPGNVGGGYAKNVGSPISTSNLGSWSN
jgi:uncharacterized protein YkwD